MELFTFQLKVKKVISNDSRNQDISSRIKMLSLNLKPDVVSSLKRLNEILDMPVIELLANDGKITANRISLQFASSAVHAKLLENPDLTILDMKTSKKATIDNLLCLIYNGKTKFNDEVEKQEVISLAQELGIDIIQSASSGKKIKIDAPIVPEEEPKDEDPGLMELKDGNFSCGICFKFFTRKSNAKRHYKDVHMAKLNQGKPFSCKIPGCDKKFGSQNYMKSHMRKCHGIPAKIIPSTKQKAKKQKGPSKKVIAEEPQNIDAREEPIED